MYIFIFIELNSPSYFLHQPSDISPSSPHYSMHEQKGFSLQTHRIFEEFEEYSSGKLSVF